VQARLRADGGDRRPVLLQGDVLLADGVEPGVEPLVLDARRRVVGVGEASRSEIARLRAPGHEPREALLALVCGTGAPRNPLGVVPVQRLKARWKALGWEKPSTNAISARLIVPSATWRRAVSPRTTSSCSAYDVPRSPRRRCSVRALWPSFL